MSWLCPDNTKHDPVVYGAEFGVVVLAKGQRTTSIHEGFDCLAVYVEIVVYVNKCYTVGEGG